ncbi:hypothetical protein SacmaDRAFT_3891 [Saccharomonospora marina XMU15]|uniref:Uncharacterized protein n=1 Tax=Saccharomonospora marina XMU15 TaxID=882083 RepID=H5X2V1_9PSEU|nr:hypothetical protein SacmaDRAFT_3891 [Saccharomonospora marina XMU15]
MAAAAASVTGVRAAELPAAVVADLLDLDTGTA